jgi:hypothetical protein
VSLVTQVFGRAYELLAQSCMDTGKMTSKIFSNYDSFPWIYDKYWSDMSTGQMLNILQTSALDDAPRVGNHS